MNKSYRAGGIVINKEGKIALSNEHHWGFPRGGVEEGESYEECARREILEEVGLDNLVLIKDLGYYERYPGDINGSDSNAYPMEIHMFLFCTGYCGDLNPKESNVKEAKWVDIDSVGESLPNEKDREFYEKNVSVVKRLYS